MHTTRRGFFSLFAAAAVTPAALKSAKLIEPTTGHFYESVALTPSEIGKGVGESLFDDNMNTIRQETLARVRADEDLAVKLNHLLPDMVDPPECK